MKRRCSGLTRYAQKIFTLLVLFSLVLPLVACEELRGGEVGEVARYGSLGRSFALRLVKEYPFRAPGSSEEQQVADFLVAELTRMGLSPEKIDFDYRSPHGENKSSSNIVATIPGRSLVVSEVDTQDPLSYSVYQQLPANIEERYILVGAHYDTKYSKAEALHLDGQRGAAELDEDGNPIRTMTEIPPLAESDGIDDNAAAVASLLTLVQALQQTPPVFEVRLVFFGAGHDEYAGAKAYAASLSEADVANMHCMVNLDSIYGGDKVYAHAGQNSVLGGEVKDYAKRQSLYICTDAYYNNLLLTNNGFSLYTNQIGGTKELPGIGPAVYREWTERESDHTVFDRLGVPIVFFESANYNVSSPDVPIKQSDAPYFAAVDGMIAGTGYDSSAILTAYYVPAGQYKDLDYFGREEETGEPADDGLEATEEVSYVDITDPLEIRINNLAFIIAELCCTVPYGMEVR